MCINLWINQMKSDLRMYSFSGNKKREDISKKHFEMCPYYRGALTLSNFVGKSACRVELLIQYDVHLYSKIKKDVASPKIPTYETSFLFILL
ncbi:hypothetical protein bcgnr5380_55340 [Bacillus cereus]